MDPAQTEWNEPIVAMRKKNGPLRFSVYYQE